MKHYDRAKIARDEYESLTGVRAEVDKKEQVIIHLISKQPATMKRVNQ